MVLLTIVSFSPETSSSGSMEEISSIDQLHQLLDEKAIGKRIPVLVLRRGKKKYLNVIPG